MAVPDQTGPDTGFEQVGPIGTTLPSNDTSIKTHAGDIMLYTSDQMVIFYGSNSWSYTRLGKITGKSQSELRDLTLVRRLTYDRKVKQALVEFFCYLLCITAGNVVIHRRVYRFLLKC